MTMNITRLITYWSPAEAATAIDLLDTLRDAIWHTYGEQITNMYREADHNPSRHTDQCEPEFDDDIPF
jgi:hypothetical protein